MISLCFFTGANEIPPMGLPFVPKLQFNSSSPFPTASTCALVLTLSTMYADDEKEFESHMNDAFISHGGFGLC